MPTTDIKTKYTSIFITNIPSFYKTNLYNAIHIHQDILVIFTGDLIQERTSDFFDSNFKFDYVNMAGWTTLKKCLYIYRLIKRVIYKELVIGGWDSLPLWTAAVIGNKSKNATVIESSSIESETHGIKGKLKNIYFNRISKVYASGKSQAKIATSFNLEPQSIVITKGVGVFNFRSQSVYQCKSEIRNFLYVGRLSEEKNLAFLIKIFNQLPKLTLNIVGFGHQENELRLCAKSNIHFLGSIPNKQLYKVYQSNDVFILPSKVEPWGLVVEEALNNGLPLLLSNRVGCAEEILIEDINGYLFDYDNEESLISAIKRISTPSIYNRMAEYISHMDFNKIEEEQVKCYLHE